MYNKLIKHYSCRALFIELYIGLRQGQSFSDCENACFRKNVGTTAVKHSSIFLLRLYKKKTHYSYRKNQEKL